MLFILLCVDIFSSSVDAKHPGCDQSYVGEWHWDLTSLDNGIYMRFQSFHSAGELEILSKTTVLSSVYMHDITWLNIPSLTSFSCLYYALCAITNKNSVTSVPGLPNILYFGTEVVLLACKATSMPIVAIMCLHH